MVVSNLLLVGVLVGVLVSVTAIEPTNVTLDASMASNRTFDGVGGCSGGGGGTRLLYDYPEPMRSDILDFLFKPGFGASLQHLKVEIGADGDTTQGSEQSHMHSADDTSDTAFDRGYETWLMLEARRRNPRIVLSGLIWGVPGWVANSSTGGFFGRSNIDYQLAWLRGLWQHKRLRVDAIGSGYNEHGFDANFVKEFKAALLNDTDLAHVKTVAADQCCGSEYRIVDAMRDDPAVAAAVDVVGTHCPGPINGRALPPKDVMDFGKPLWDTEQHFGLPDPSPAKAWEWRAAADLATTINRVWIDTFHTQTLMWTPIYSWYSWLNYPGKGLMVANTPWSGWYNVTAPVWVAAHTTQFTDLGWRYLGGGGCARLSGGGSFVSLVSPLAGHGNGGHGITDSPSRDFTVVVETMGATGAQSVQFSRDESLRGKPLTLWTTNQTDVFVHRGAVPTDADGGFIITVPANELWTITTTTGQSKGTAAIPPQAPFNESLPLVESFDEYAEDTLPRYFSDMHGAFSVVTDAGASSGVALPKANKVLRQQATSRPDCTHAGRSKRLFATAIGDATWRNYTVRVQALIESQGRNESERLVFVGSHAGASTMSPEEIFDSVAVDGFVLVLRQGGAWSLSEGTHSDTLAHGVAAGGFPADEWLGIELSVHVPPVAPTTSASADHTAGTAPCDASQQSQQFRFDSQRQLCNTQRSCLNVPGCDTSKPLIWYAPSYPGHSCAEKCGCRTSAGRAGCGNWSDPTKYDCNTNAEWVLTSAGKIVNQIQGGCLYERADRTVALRGCGGSDNHYGGDEQDLWFYDAATLSVTNVHSGNCLGQAGTPPPKPESGAFVSAKVGGEILCSQVRSKSSEPSGPAFLGTGVHWARFDNFSVVTVASN